MRILGFTILTNAKLASHIVGTYKAGWNGGVSVGFQMCKDLTANMGVISGSPDIQSQADKILEDMRGN